MKRYKGQVDFGDWNPDISSPDAAAEELQATFEHNGDWDATFGQTNGELDIVVRFHMLGYGEDTPEFRYNFERAILHTLSCFTLEDRLRFMRELHRAVARAEELFWELDEPGAPNGACG